MWETIIDEIQHVAVVYMAIGCAIQEYQELTQANNQQCPCFLDKFAKKLLILIDPNLEKPLKVQQQITDLKETRIDNHRVLKNSSSTIYAINEPFYYILSDENVEKRYRETDQNFSLLLRIISIAIELKIKFIFQDYTGNDTTNVYCELMNIFDTDDLLKYVTFDVTQKDSGCYINIHPEIIKYDSDNNFIQEKFLSLSRINQYDSFRDILKMRIDLLNYQLLWTFNKSIDENEWKPFDTDKIRFMCAVYKVDTRFLDYNTDLMFAIDCVKELMIIIIKDIVESLNCEEDLVTYLTKNFRAKSEFVNMTSMLKQFN